MKQKKIQETLISAVIMILKYHAGYGVFDGKFCGCITFLIGKN